MIAKVLESLVLERMQDILKEAGIPHINQSAYRKNSCAEAIFTTQETIGRYMREGSRVCICLHNLQKAFDSVEFPVLLDCLYKVGINNVEAWYTSSVCCVKIEKERSVSFTPVRGVRQGSVLSRLCFVLERMQDILKEADRKRAICLFYSC